MAIDYKKVSYEISYNNEDYFNPVSITVKYDGDKVASDSFGCIEEAAEWVKQENERYKELSKEDIETEMER